LLYLVLELLQKFLGHYVQKPIEYPYYLDISCILDLYSWIFTYNIKDYFVSIFKFDVKNNKKKKLIYT